MDKVIFGKPHHQAEKRNSIIAFVEGLDGKILTINWGNNLGGKLLIGGGLNEGEDLVKCAEREIIEETGYTDLEHIETLPQTIINNYFAASKNVWRTINITALKFKLTSDSKQKTKLEEDEKDKFTVEWHTKEELANSIKDPAHAYVFKEFGEVN